MRQSLTVHFISEPLQTAEDGPAFAEYTSEVIAKNQILVSKHASDKTTEFDESARALAHQAKVEAFMTKNPITAEPMEPLEKVAAIMRKNKIGGIPVVTEKKLVGIITESDIFQAFIEILGGNEDGVRIELSIGNEARSIYRTVDIFKKHDMHLLTLTVCNNGRSDSRLLTLRFRGEDVDPLIDDLCRSGCKINSIIRE